MLLRAIAPSEGAEAEAECECGVYFEFVADLVEGVVVVNIGGVDGAVLGIEFGSTVNLHTEIHTEIEQLAGDGFAPAETHVGTERLDSQTAVDITVAVDRDGVVADNNVTAADLLEFVAVAGDFHQVAAAKVRADCYIQRDASRHGIDVEDHLTLCAAKVTLEVDRTCAVHAGCRVADLGIGVESDTGHERYAGAHLHPVSNGRSHFNGDTVGADAHTGAKVIEYRLLGRCRQSNGCHGKDYSDFFHHGLAF